MRSSYFPLTAVAAVIAILLTSCSHQTTPEEATNTFFEQIIGGQIGQAYENSAFQFRAQQSEKFFETTLKELGLAAIKSAKCDPAELDDNGRTAKVRVELAADPDRTIPLVVTLTQESGTWKVFAVKSPRDIKTGLVGNPFSAVGRGPDFVEPVQKQEAPDEAAARALALDSLLLFSAAVRSGDFSDLFDKCSLAWQDQLVTGEVTFGIPKTMRVPLTEKQKELGASRLQRAFQPFVEKQVDLAGVAEKMAVLDHPPRISTEGLLLVAGTYPTEPYRVVFSMKFVYEVPKWKLFGLDVSLRK